MSTSSPTPPTSSSRSPDREHASPSSSNEPRSSSAGPSSSSSSSSSTTRPHHLLPPLTPIPPPSNPNQAGPSNPNPNPNPNSNSKPGGPIFANEILDPQLLGHREPLQKTRNPVPEKCLTFCSQRQDMPPLCRMFCLRRRRPVASQKEELAKLRPTSSHESTASSSSSSSSKKETGEGWSWSPFKALERRFAPWSFIYVKGSPEGVVGRYMEELEGDDGNRDFGSVSRGASELQRRKAGDGMEYIDWGEHGALLHLPLKSLFYPIISFPQTIERVFAPSLRLLNLYKDSFTDGAQIRNLTKIKQEVESGGAFKLFDKIGTHYRKKVGERREELEKQLKEREREKKEVEKELKEKGTIVFGEPKGTSGSGSGGGRGQSSAKERDT